MFSGLFRRQCFKIDMLTGVEGTVLPNSKCAVDQEEVAV